MWIERFFVRLPTSSAQNLYGVRIPTRTPWKNIKIDKKFIISFVKNTFLIIIKFK